TGVARRELDQLGHGEPRETQQEPVEPGERLVAVARDRGPGAGRVAQPRPAPLALVAIPIAEEEIHEARREKRAGVHRLVLVLLEPLEQLVGVHDLRGAGEAWLTVPPAGLALLERAEHVPELGAELAQ